LQWKLKEDTMAIGNVCTTEVAVAGRNTTVQDAARMMRQLHVGDLVVVEGGKTPVGIVTDRDIVLSVVATGLDPAVFTIGDLITRDLVTCRYDTGVFECIQLMRIHGVRRMPVIDRDGGLVGIVSVDDLVELLADELGELGKLIAREQAHEFQARR
jgi:CBS domain-containing protein